MKTFLISNPSGIPIEGKTETLQMPVSWIFVPDSALSNAGKPFFIPEGEDFVNVALSPFFRISRLGKTISPKFSPRYIDSVAAGLHFSLPAYAEKLKKNGLPGEAALSFDRAFFYGDFLPLDNLNREDTIFRLIIDDEEKASWSLKSSLTALDVLIAEISRLNTVKIGDLIIPDQSQEFPVRIGSKVLVTDDKDVLLTVKIK